MKSNIEFRKTDHDLFLLFWKKFEKKIDALKNVVIENTQEGIILTYETPAHTSKLTLKLIKLWLADAMVIYYKEKYLEQNLIVPKENKVPFNILIKALSIFDKATDTEFVYEKMGDMKNFNVHSFYVFRLGELRFRWQEICDLFYKSLPSLIESDAFLELLRYLLVVTENGVSVVNLSLDGDFLLIKDGKNKFLADPIKLTETDGSVKVILELITLAPQKLVVWFSENKNPELSGFIKNLFASKVVYCT